MALLGEAFVRVRPDTDGFEKEASSALGGGLKKVAGLVTAAFASIKVGGFLKDAITEASDYGETVSKSANVFGAKLQPALLAFAKTAPKAFGISETAALAASAQFGNMFKQLGFTGDAAAKASTNLIKTAADLGSFNNVDPTDVLERIGASLRGEFDSLQQLIPNINAARVEHEALAATGKKVAKELTAQEKATATLAIIQKDGALAANDFAETSGGLANQQRILSATVDGLQRRLGDAFLPIVTKVVTFLAANAVPTFEKVAAAFSAFGDGLRGTSTPLIEFNPRLLAIKEAGEKAAEVFTVLKDAFAVFFDALRGRSELNEFDGGLRLVNNAGIFVNENFAKVRQAVVDFFTGVRNGKVELPQFAALLTVGAGALKLVTDNADLVIKALPFLVAGFLAVKTAQAASTVVALASLPLQAATIVSNFAAAGANRALATAIAQQTVIQNANAVSTSRGTLATIAATIKTAASTVVKIAATVATAALTVATTALGVAITFATGPVGLIVIGIGLLIAGFVLAYRNSETFRGAVNALVAVVKGQVVATFNTAKAAVDGIGSAFAFVFDKAGDLIGVLGRLANAIRNLPAVGAVTSLIGKIPGFASGGTLGAGLSVVGERGPELVFSRRGGERVLSNENSARLMSRSADGSPSGAVDLSPLLAEVAALRAEVAGQRADIRALPRDYQLGMRAGYA